MRKTAFTEIKEQVQIRDADSHYILLLHHVRSLVKVPVRRTAQ